MHVSAPLCAVGSMPATCARTGHWVNNVRCDPRCHSMQRQRAALKDVSSLGRAPRKLPGVASSQRGALRPRSRLAAARSEAPGPLRPGMVVSSGAAEDEGDDADGTGIRLECDESGCVLVMEEGNMPTLVEKEKPSEHSYLRCSLSGCEYVSEVPEADFRVIEGEGWRLCYETAPSSEETFSAAVGSKGWNVALTATEFNAFCELLQMLRKGIVTMSHDGIIGRDDIVLKVERSSVFMECRLPKKRLPSLHNIWKFGSGLSEKYAFDVTFILFGTPGQRQAEGYWPAEAVMDMLKKIDELSAAAEGPTDAPLPRDMEVPAPAAA